MHLAATPMSVSSKSLLGVFSALALIACGNPPEPPAPLTPITPIVASQTIEVNEGTPKAITLAGEARPDDTLVFTIVEAPTNGTLEGTPPSVTYVPNAHYLGEDAFTYTVSAGERTSEPARISIEVLNAPFFTITRGSSTKTSSLYFTDSRGTTSLVGDTGHALIAIKVDPTDGKLYAATRQEDASGRCDNCLVTLDRSTGAATVVGVLEHDENPDTNDGPVPSLAFTSDGALFGFTERNDDAVSIDKATGRVTVLGESNLNSWGHGMWTDTQDTLWFLNGNGDVYTIDPRTGVPTLIHEPGVLRRSFESDPIADDFPLRGDRNPLTGIYWGMPPKEDGVPFGLYRVEINAGVARYVDAPFEIVADAHNLAFAR